MYSFNYKYICICVYRIRQKSGQESRLSGQKNMTVIQAVVGVEECGCVRCVAMTLPFSV